MRKKTLGRFIVRKYVTFSIGLIFCLSCIYILIGSAVTLKDNKFAANYIFAEDLVKADYKKIDISHLKDVSGWIEILDKNNDVIYTKGKVLEKRHHYTEEQLLKQSAFSRSAMDDSVQILGLHIGYSKYDFGEGVYLASYAPFTDQDGKRYTCIVKIPIKKIKFNYTLINPTGETGKLTSIGLTIYFISTILLFLLFVYWYSRNIRKHITRPNDMLVEGLRTVTSGNYTKRLSLNAEYEYAEIEDSFNFMAEELSEASKQRHRYEQERQQLLSSIVHDLKTPITSINGYARALIEGMVKEPQKQQEYLQTIYNKTEHMNRLTELLSTYTKMDNSSYALKLEKMDLCEYVREIIAEAFDELEKNNIELELEIPDQIIEVFIDKVEMKRVIENLISNAVKHNPKNSIIKVCLFKSGINGVILEICDNGGRIPESLAEKMFEPFVCGDESRMTKNGSGLGLSICKKIVEKHGGELKYKRLSGAWKCFEISLNS